MIGQPLQKINHVCLADDYNKLVSVIQPFQNFQIGQGLNGYISPHGISISVGKTGSSGSFNHPFKVTSDSLSSATVQFGRVFEERNFQGNESTITNLSFIELSSSVAFDVTSGMTLDLNSTLERDSVIIAVHKDFDSSLITNFYQVCLSSDIPASYYSAHLVANLTKETSGSGSWTIEQVLMGDYTFDRNPPVPFDITKYGDKWLIYLPTNSLVINGKDWTIDITGLTYGASPIIGDWYEITNPASPYLKISYDNDIGSPGYNYGLIASLDMAGTSSFSNNTIVLWEAGEVGDGETGIIKQLVKGAQNIEKIRPDSGDANSMYKSIAVQGAQLGIIDGTTNYTLELHGFKEALAPQATEFDEVSYTHLVAVREEDTSTGLVDLRWAPLSSVTGSGTTATFDFPWKCTISETSGNIDVIIGRVYEYQSFEDSSSSDEQYAIDELVGVTYTPTQVASITCGEGDFIGVYRDYTYPNKWELGIGSNPPTNGILLQKICNVAAGPVVEQIHMGDVNFNEPTLHVFSVARLNGDSIMYIPANSIVINGQDFTSNAIGNSGTTLQATAITDWYKLLVGNFYNIYLRMFDGSGAGESKYGTVAQTNIGSTGYSGSGELITIPLYDPSLRRCYQNGAVFKEFIRTDSHGSDTTGNRFSLSESVGDDASTGDRTMQIRNFAAGTANSDVLDGSGAYDYTFLVRELDSGNNNAEIKYAAYSALSGAIAESITNDTTIITEIFNEFWTWYDNLSSTSFSGRGFWEKGADYKINYGTSIGKDTNTEVIDLTNLQLKGGIWTCAGNFNSSTDLGYQLGESNFRWSVGHIESLYSSGVQVVGNQQAAIPDSDGTLSGNTAAINSILGALRAHGLIAS